MSWLVEAFRHNDGLEWEVELRPVPREELEVALGLPDISIPASYPLTVEQVVSALGFSTVVIERMPDLDSRRLAFYLSEVADEPPGGAVQ